MSNYESPEVTQIDQSWDGGATRPRKYSWWDRVTGNDVKQEEERKQSEILRQRKFLFDSYVGRMSKTPSNHSIIFISKKGGSTKTTTTLGVGNAFGRYAIYPSIAIDANTDQGSILMQNGWEHDRDIMDLLEVLGQVETRNQALYYANSSPQSRLDVIGSRKGAERSLGPWDYYNVLNCLQKFWPLVLSDGGIDFTLDTNPIIETMLDWADTPVICSDASVIGRQFAQDTIDAMYNMGQMDLIPRTVVSISSTTPFDVDEQLIRAEFAKKGVNRVVFVPYDDYLADPNTQLFLWDRLHPLTQMAYISIAANISDNFA